jgi:hypothetical protein
MKRILTLLSVLLSLGYTASAQSADLAILNSFKSPLDTIRFSTNGSRGRIIQYTFINYGPTALTNTDTILLKTPTFASPLRLSLPAAGLPANDTVYFIDTIFVTAAPATNPYTWCDSIWAKNSSNTVIPDPVLSNNKTCKTVRFLMLPGVGVNTVAGNDKGELSVYPNPTSNQINFSYEFGSNEAATVTLRDLLGKTVLQRDLGKGISGKQSYSLDINSLQNGIYFLELSSNGVKSINRVVVQK